MEENIPITWLNDFTFCPKSIYFHNIYDHFEKSTFQQTPQLNGLSAHKNIDEKTYSTSKKWITGLEVFSEKLGVIGKIDMYDVENGVLIERKRTIQKIYDGYLYQIWAQYFALKEMGYTVNKLFFHSITDNKRYEIEIPKLKEKQKIKKLISQMKKFDIGSKYNATKEKCENCIYHELCDTIY